MDTEIDWRREIDASFGSGTDAPVGAYVAAGHRAVLRRRATLALAGVATAAVVAGTAWAVSPASEAGPSRSEAPVATDPSRSSTPTADGSRDAGRRPAANADFLGNPAALVDGEVLLAPGSGPVLEQVANPMGYTPRQGSSVALRVRAEGREQYSLMTATADGSTSTQTVDATGGPFRAWLDQAVRTQRELDVANGVTAPSGTGAPGELLRLTPAGRVTTAGEAVVLLGQDTDVDLGPAFAAPAATTGAVHLLVDGADQYAVYRVLDGELDVIPAGGGFDSLPAFVAWARQQYGSGEGLR